MTILRDRGTRQIECDECSNTGNVYDEDDFQIMVQSAKDGGWLIKTDGRGDYTHLCPNCRHGDRVAAARKKFGL